MILTNKNTISILFTTFHTENLIVILTNKIMIADFISNLCQRVISIIKTFLIIAPKHAQRNTFEGKEYSYFDLLKNIFKILITLKIKNKKSSNTLSNTLSNFTNFFTSFWKMSFLN